MNLRDHFAAYCASLRVEQALLVRGSGRDGPKPAVREAERCRQAKGTRVIAAWRLSAAEQARAVAAAPKLRPGEFCAGAALALRSRYVFALNLSPASRGGRAAPLLLVGSPRREEAAARAQALASLLSTHWENAALRERAYRLGRAAMLGELVFQTAHEMNNPLASVVGFADLLSGRACRSQRARETLGRLKSEAERTLEIARRLLSLAPKEAGLQTLDWNALVRRALDLRAHAMKLAAIQVRAELSPHPLPVAGPPVRLLHAVLNILVNAEQALEARSYPRVIVVRTEQAGPARAGAARAVLQIANNGPRIPAGTVRRMFDSFFTTKPAGQGTGLGLPMARAAMTSAGGTIGVENLPPGALFPEGGVRFRLALPLASRKHQEAAQGARKAAGENGLLRGARVLVVEDERSLAQLFKEALREQGCHVRVCASAEDALAEAVARPYDAAVSDFKLPGHDGAWLLEKLRHCRAGLARRVLFITGDTLGERARRLLRATGQPVLPKPFHLAELTSAVGSLLSGRRGGGS